MYSSETSEVAETVVLSRRNYDFIMLQLFAFQAEASQEAKQEAQAMQHKGMNNTNAEEK